MVVVLVRDGVGVPVTVFVGVRVSVSVVADGASKSAIPPRQ